MLFGKFLVKYTMGMFDNDQIYELKTSNYQPNLLDKAFFQISRLAFWITFIIFATYICCMLMSDYANNTHLLTHTPNFRLKIEDMAILMFVWAGLPASVYFYGLTGLKILRVDIGFRLVAIFIWLFWTINRISNLIYI